MPHDLFKLISLTEGWAFHSCNQHSFHLANICLQVPYLTTLGFYLKFKKNRKRQKEGGNQTFQFWNKKICGGNSWTYTKVKRKVVNIPELSMALTLLFCSQSRLSVERRYFWYRILQYRHFRSGFQTQVPTLAQVLCAPTEQEMPHTTVRQLSSHPHTHLPGTKPLLHEVWSTDRYRTTNCSGPATREVQKPRASV